MRALVAGWIGSTNLGDELVFRGLRTHLDALGVETTAISVDPAATSRVHGVDAVRHRRPQDSFGLWRAAGAADVLVFGGGGLVQDQTSPWNIPFHASRVVMARLRRRPWAAVGVGVDPLGATWLRRVVQAGLGGSVAFGVRDRASAEAARSMGLSPRLTADLAFATPVSSPARNPLDILVVCVRPPTRPGIGTAATKARQPVAPDWITTLADSIDRIASRHGLAVRFVAFQPDRDAPVAQAVAARIQAPADVVDADLDDVVATMSEARGVVTMRYHGAVTASLAGRPAVLLDYSPKMSHLAADLGPGFRSLPIDTEAAALESAFADVLTRANTVQAARESLIQRETGNRTILEALLERAGR